MSLNPIQQLLKTYTTSPQNDEYKVREVVNTFLKGNDIPKLEGDEKVFIKKDTLCFTVYSSVRSYEINHIKNKLLAHVVKSIPQLQRVTTIRFL